MLTIEIKLIPNAVFKAFLKSKFCFMSIMVSKIILVINPLIIANIMMPRMGKGILDN
jgi:hypothetical protein